MHKCNTKNNKQAKNRYLIIIKWKTFITEKVGTNGTQYERGTGADTCPAIVSGMVTGDAPVRYWLIISIVPGHTLRSLGKS